MIRGSRLVIPVRDSPSMYHQMMFDGHSFAFEDVPRIELSLEECEAILTNLPMIIEFVIRERPKKEQEGKK